MVLVFYPPKARISAMTINIKLSYLSFMLNSLTALDIGSLSNMISFMCGINAAIRSHARGHAYDSSNLTVQLNQIAAILQCKMGWPPRLWNMKYFGSMVPIQQDISLGPFYTPYPCQRSGALFSLKRLRPYGWPKALIKLITII
jgi:hypothetical protein